MASMPDKRRRPAARGSDRNGQRPGKVFLKRAAAVVAAMVLIMMPVLWALGMFSPPKPVTEIRQLVDQQVAEYNRIARGEAPYGSAPSAGDAFRQMGAVPREYREQVRQEMDRLWQARERAEMGSYFALAPQQRQAELDRRIKSEEERRRQMQAEREKRDQQRAATGQQAANAGARASGPGGQTPGGGGGPAGGGQRGGSDEARLQRSKQRIDQTTPEQRAQQAEYRRAMEVRRKQLGLPAGGGRRGG